MTDPIFHIVAEHELATGGLPVRTEHTPRSTGGVVAIIADAISRPGFRSLTVEAEPLEQQLALAA